MPPPSMIRDLEHLANEHRIRDAIAETLMHAPNYLPYLKTLDRQILQEVCSRTALTYPNISVLTIINPELRNKFSDSEQSTIISKNCKIAIALYEKKDILYQLGGLALHQICEDTINNKPEISLYIFSTKELREKIIVTFQSSILRQSFIVCEALYRKGFEFLQDLKSSCLRTICYTTAKEKPQISADIISWFPAKFDQHERRILFILNPQIEIELKKRQANNNNSSNSNSNSYNSHNTIPEPTTTTTPTPQSFLAFFTAIASMAAGSYWSASPSSLDINSNLRRNFDEAIEKTKKLYQEKGDFLSYLASVNEEMLYEVCLKTAKEFPDISIAVILNDALSSKIPYHHKTKIIKENKYIALKMGQSNYDSLEKMSGWILEDIGEMTINDDPTITLRIFSNKTLRDKLSTHKQRTIIEKSFTVAKALYEKGVNFVGTLSLDCMIGICLATATQRPDISIDIITNFDYLFDGILEYQDIINKNPKIAEGLNKRRASNNNTASPPLNPRGNTNSRPISSNNNNNNNTNPNRFFTNPGNLEQLSADKLYDLCITTAKEKPKISLHILVTPSLRNKLTIQQQMTLISSNSEIAFQLGIKSNQFLSQIHGDCLEAICRMTVKNDYAISYTILSDKSLRERIPDADQALIIRANAELARDLYIENGYPFLQELQPKALAAICLATATSRPEIANYILGEHELNNKIEPVDREKIISLINNSAHQSQASTPFYTSPGFQ